MVTLSFPASRLRVVLGKLATLYADMDAAYAAAAGAVGDVKLNGFRGEARGLGNGQPQATGGESGQGTNES